jgi:hypothetical protein
MSVEFRFHYFKLSLFPFSDAGAPRIDNKRCAVRSQFLAERVAIAVGQRMIEHSAGEPLPAHDIKRLLKSICGGHRRTRTAQGRGNIHGYEPLIFDEKDAAT